MEKPVWAKAVGKTQVRRKHNFQYAEDRKHLLPFDLHSILFPASQSDCLFVSAPFQDDELCKNVPMFSRKGVCVLSYSIPNYLRRSYKKGTASLSLNLRRGLMSRQISDREFESEGVTCCLALKGISVKLNKVLITRPGQGIILSIRVHHF